MSTTALYKALIVAKVPEEIAERAVEGLASNDNIATEADIVKLASVVARLETELKEKATKADLARLETAVARLETELKEKATKADLAGLKTVVDRLETDLADKATKSDLADKATKADLDTKITELENKMLRWGIGIAVGMTAINIGAVGLIMSL